MYGNWYYEVGMEEIILLCRTLEGRSLLLWKSITRLLDSGWQCCSTVWPSCGVAVQRQMGLSNGGQHFLPWSRDRPHSGIGRFVTAETTVHVVVVVHKVALRQASVLPCHNIPPLSQTRMLSGTSSGS
jgi:hypothetical protein